MRGAFTNAIVTCLSAACTEAGLDVSVTRFSSACLGFSGGPADKEAILKEILPSERMLVTHDALIALSGATAGEPGVIVIAGTGSMAFGRNAAGETARARKLKDPGIVVIDEVVGQWLSLAGATALNWKSYLAAFLLFRVFDIWKPPPVRQLEALPGGLGINADDAMAGFYAAVVLFAAGCFNLY